MVRTRRSHTRWTDFSGPVSRNQQALNMLPGNTTAMYHDGWSPTVIHQDITGGTNPGGLNYTLDPASTPRTARGGANSTVEYLANDGNGNTGTILDSNGDVRCQARYDAYGQADGNLPVSTPLAGQCASGLSINDVFYRGTRRDTGTGQYQYGSRTYDPAKGSFLTPDTHRTGGSSINSSVGTDPLTANTYSYVNGDPVNLSDPSGHRAIANGGGEAGCNSICLFRAEEQRQSNLQITPAKPKGKSFLENARDAIGGFGHAAYEAGPGAVADVMRLASDVKVPGIYNPLGDWQADKIDQFGQWMSDEWGADTTSSVYKNTHKATTVVSYVAGGAGVARAGVRGAVTLARNPKGALTAVTEAGSRALEGLKTAGAKAREVTQTLRRKKAPSPKAPVGTVADGPASSVTADLATAPRAPVASAAEAATVPGPNGALRNVATGQFAPNPATVHAGTSASVHGNSRNSSALTYLYRLEDDEGELVKWGITSNIKGRYPASFLEDKTLVPMTSGSRSDMLNLERWIVERDPGPLNLERWAGVAQ